MAFLTRQVRNLPRFVLGVLFAVSLWLASNAFVTPASVYAADSGSAVMRSERRIDRERSVRTIQGDRSTDRHSTSSSSSRRPRAVRH